MLLLVIAVLLPPHGRVNPRCYTAWNSQKTNLEVVWDGARYSQPWTFSTEVDSGQYTCQADACVQRLWCTDSGAAGYYSRQGADYNVPLHYTWLRDTALRGQRVLAVQGQEGDATTMTATNAYGHGTLLVMGSTLFFYTFDYTGSVRKYGLPRLTSLVFAEYAAGKTADQLVTQELTAFNVLGYASADSWYANWSPIYPAGAGALTISVEDYYGGDAWAVDVSLSVSGGSATRKAMVHLPYRDVPSIRSASREVLTVPGFSCRAYTSGAAPKCHRIGESTAKYTWASTEQTTFGWSFTPLSALASFSLPSALWLHDGTADGSTSFRVLAAFGLGPAVAFAGSAFHGVESLPDAACASGRRLFLVAREVPAMAELRREALACEWRQVFPEATSMEAGYAAAAVKWLGPWAGPLFVAADVEAHEYRAAGEPDTGAGDASLEHVYRLDQGRGTIRLGALACPWASVARVPPDSAVLRESVRRDSAPCVRLLLASARGSARDTGARGEPLLLLAPGPAMALLLVDHGADLEAKNASGWTSLMAMASEGQPLAGHLARGAAVCTWPRSVFDLRRRGLRIRVDAARRPCEPGFWLRAGAACAGLAPCAEGFFCPGHRERSNGRTPCPPGTYGPHAMAAGAVQCRPCPADRPFSPPASADVSLCSRDDSPAWDASEGAAPASRVAGPLRWVRRLLAALGC